MNELVAKTSSTNSIMSTTGMPRRNSSTIRVGTLIQALSEMRIRHRSRPSGKAITADTAAAASVAPMPAAIRAQTSGSWKTAQRLGSKIPCWARVMTARTRRPPITITPMMEPISETRRALGPGTS